MADEYYWFAYYRLVLMVRRFREETSRTDGPRGLLDARFAGSRVICTEFAGGF
jgi:hypothetical protein